MSILKFSTIIMMLILAPVIAVLGQQLVLAP